MFELFIAIHAGSFLDKSTKFTLKNAGKKPGKNRGKTGEKPGRFRGKTEKKPAEFVDVGGN